MIHDTADHDAVIVESQSAIDCLKILCLVLTAWKISAFRIGRVVSGCTGCAVKTCTKVAYIKRVLRHASPPLQAKVGLVRQGTGGADPGKPPPRIVVLKYLIIRSTSLICC